MNISMKVLEWMRTPTEVATLRDFAPWKTEKCDVKVFIKLIHQASPSTSHRNELFRDSGILANFFLAHSFINRFWYNFL